MTARNTSNSGRSLLRWTLALLLCVPVIGAAACSSDKPCEGVTIEGQCQQKCVESKCPAGDRCVIDNDLNNACAAPCQTQGDCPVGKNCVTWGFTSDNSQAQVCARLPYTRGGRTGQHEDCASSSECDTMRGFACIGGKCEVKCSSSRDCGSLGVCNPDGTDDQGNKAGFCAPDDKPRAPGQFGTACPNGDECDKTSNFGCLGAGPGDLDAYCTLRDCGGDSDCPQDFRCSLERTAVVPCQDACGITGDATQADCAQASDVGAGKKFECGPLSLLRHICTKRSFCDECQTDVDCASAPGQICAKDSNGNKYCTVTCDPKTDSCPWGSAATCDVWDKDLGIPTCAHRFGSCKGTGKSCEPCRDDADCPGGLCLTAQFSGEHYCVDMAVTCDCTGFPVTQNAVCDGGGCPQSPGGVTLSCYGGSAEATSALYKKCVGGNTQSSPLATPQTGCWPN